MITIASVISGDVTISLIQRPSADFVILYDSAALAAISHRTIDHAAAHRIFQRAVSIAELGFEHPAWRRKARTVNITTKGD